MVADDVSATGGDVSWSSGEIVDLHSITFPFTGTLDSNDGLITINIGNTTNAIANPFDSGTYLVTLTFHDNLSGLDPYYDRFSTQIVITDGIEFDIDVESALEFSIRDVTDSYDVSSINYGEIEAGIAYDRSHIFKVSTNAFHGYTVTINEESDLTSAGGNVPDFVGTNMLPLAWQSPPGSGTDGYYGYHTSDSSLGTGIVDRFMNPDRWAAITGVPQEVAYNDQLIQNDTTTITFRLEVTGDQPTGYYEHVVQYICTPKY